MCNTFNFQEALSYIKTGIAVSLILNNVERTYRLNCDGDIICTPNNKEHLAYKVNLFHIDAIMSKDWKFSNNTKDETNKKQES